MKRSFPIAIVGLLVVGLLVAVAGSSVLAYEPPPGIMGPDEVDFQGETVYIYTWDGSHFDRQFGPEGRAGLGRVEQAEELFNVKLEFPMYNPWEGMGELLTRLIAEDSKYDWYRLQPTHPLFEFWGLVGQNALYPISDILPAAYYESLAPQDRNSVISTTVEGASYGFGSVYGPWSEFAIVTMYNEDLLNREGLPDPYELWQAGEWTWEAMEEIAKAATKDTTGDGEVDQFGIGWTGVPNWRLEQTAFHMAQVNHADLTREVDGNVHFTFNEEPAIQAMEQVRKWHNDDRIIGGANFREGNVAISPYEILIWTGSGAQQLWDNTGETARIVPIPWGPNTTRDVFPVHEAETFILPVNVAEPEKMLALHSFLWQSDDHVTFDEYITHPPLARTREDAEILRLANEYLDAAPAMKALAAPYLGAAFEQIIGENVSPQTAIDALVPEIQGTMDEVLKQ